VPRLCPVWSRRFLESSRYHLPLTHHNLCSSSLNHLSSSILQDQDLPQLSFLIALPPLPSLSSFPPLHLAGVAMGPSFLPISALRGFINPTFPLPPHPPTLKGSHARQISLIASNSPFLPALPVPSLPVLQQPDQFCIILPSHPLTPRISHAPRNFSIVSNTPLLRALRRRRLILPFSTQQSRPLPTIHHPRAPSRLLCPPAAITEPEPPQCPALLHRGILCHRILCHVLLLLACPNNPMPGPGS
jgi:hypothetical protein